MNGRIVGFGVITCAGRDSPGNPCGGAWRVRPGEVWVDLDWDGEDDEPDETVDDGPARLVSSSGDKNVHSGIYRVSTESVICLKGPFDADSCAALLGP